jgi:hypothetical protein
MKFPSLNILNWFGRMRNPPAPPPPHLDVDEINEELANLIQKASKTQKQDETVIYLGDNSRAFDPQKRD